MTAEEGSRRKEKVAPKRRFGPLHGNAGGRATQRPEVRFADSDLADPEVFAAAFTGTYFELANLRYYHEKVANWRKDGEPPLRRDWKATAKNFMINDVERNSLVLAPSPKHNLAGTGADRAGFAASVDAFLSRRST